MDRQYFVKLGLKLGADDVVVFEIDGIVFDTRTILTCMFGCEDWGKGPIHGIITDSTVTL